MPQRCVRCGSVLANRGHDRERAVLTVLRNDGWFAMRAPASLGSVDVVALRAGSRPRVVEVKSTAGGPYERFQPKDRAELAAVAKQAGADAFLAYWPPRGKLHWIAESDWPETRAA